MSLNRCLGLLLLPFHSEVMKQQVWAARSAWVDKAPRCAAMQWPRHAKLSLIKSNVVDTVLTFRDSVSDLSTPACKSGKLPAYKTSRRGNPRAQPSYYHRITTESDSYNGKASLSLERLLAWCATTTPISDWHILFAANECVQKISCHLSTVGARPLSCHTDYTISGRRFQNKKACFWKQAWHL